MLTERQKQLAEENVPLVHYLIHRLGMDRYRNSSELTSAGMLGLVKAASTFDESFNVKFSTWASQCIVNEARMQIRKDKKALGLLYLEDLLQKNDGSRSSVDEFTLHLAVEDKHLFIEREILRELATVLNPREKRLMVHIYFEGKKQVDFYGKRSSQGNVSRIAKNSLEKMRKKYNRMMMC